MNKKRLSAVGGSLVGLAAVVGLAVNGVAKHRQAEMKKQERIASHEAPRPVTVAPVRIDRSSRTKSYPAVIHASEETSLSFRVGGPLVEVNVEQGQRVAKGDLLMQIDPRDFKDRIQTLEAQLKGAQAIQLNAQSDFERADRLFKEKVVPQSEFDRAMSSKDSADASVDTLTVQLEIARNSLKDTSLLAPYDGTVTAQLVENHEMVAPGTVVLRFHNIGKLEAWADIPESEIMQRTLAKGMPAWIGFSAAPAERVEARLKEWSTLADPATRTYKVVFEFDAPADATVLPGMSAEVQWGDGAVAERLTVPVAALTSDGSGHTLLWVCDAAGTTVHPRMVKTGDLVGSSAIAVLEGVNENDRVVVSGSRLLRDGDAITVR